MSLNGTVQYQQTEIAVPPIKFLHKVQVPGLIDLATPKIQDYDKYFYGKQPLKYHWYKFTFKVPEKYKNKFATLTLLKSMFNTQIYLNGYDCGTYMQCSTPIEADLTPFLKLNNEENVLLIKLDEEKRLPRDAAMGFDREKFSYIPGIWDDVFINFTGPVRIQRTLILPQYSKKNMIVKLKVQNMTKILQRNMEWAFAKYTITGFVKEKKSGRTVSDDIKITGTIKSQSENIHEIIVPIQNPQAWSNDNPFLYEVVLNATVDSIDIDKYGNEENIKPDFPAYLNGISDVVTTNVGMRDFAANKDHFILNGKRTYLTGSGITLNRFFEDRDRKALPWNKEWVKKMFVDIPKKMGWNTMRISIGLLPRFWYDLADEHGIMLQNEYPMWQYRGSDHQVEKEYTDWVWSDGSHPSIVIWDALNEQKSDFIGTKLIPGLRKLDPTRIWDAGYMTATDMKVQMLEHHSYRLGYGWWNTDSKVKESFKKFTFGNLPPVSTNDENVPVLVNEYGWLWQSRDGKVSAVRTYGNFLPGQKTPYTKNYEYYEPDGSVIYKNRDIYDYFLGPNSNENERFQFQAYCMANETEVIRSVKKYAGILSFPYLTNNYGYTGDWFLNKIENLIPSETLKMQYHTLKPFAVFINHEDQRYNKNAGSVMPGSTQTVKLFATNESNDKKSGNVTLKVLDASGQVVTNSKNIPVTINAFGYEELSTTIQIPAKEGGYMLLTELTDDGDAKSVKQVSRRYIRVGNIEKPVFYNYKYSSPVM